MVCAYRIAVQRGKEVQAVIQAVRHAGGDVYHVVFTIPHDRRDDLKEMRQAVTKAHTKTVSGRPWKKIKHDLGIIGWVRALEVTHGWFGWHPHLHILLFTRHPLSQAQIDVLWQFLYERWSDAIVAAGYRSPNPERGLVISHGKDAGHYVTKICNQGLAAEISQADSKKGRLASRSIPQIIDDWGDHRRESDKLLLLEWLGCMYQARHLTWSRGFRKQYLPAEQLNLPLAQDPDTSAAELIYEFTDKQTDFLTRFDRTLCWRIPEATKKHGRPGVIAELVIVNFDFRNAPARPPPRAKPWPRVGTSQ
ncbi:unnamed protein product [marine sediment metagenome]|uniref:Replication protein n=2 Tax=marine sediment metagenome TaxID=412755 RepID=X1JKV6_9ZZZZ